jgi:hypothetical protein
VPSRPSAAIPVAGAPVARSFSSSVVQVHLAAGSLHSPPGTHMLHHPPAPRPSQAHQAAPGAQAGGDFSSAHPSGPQRLVSTTALSTAHEGFADSDVVGAYFQDDADYSFADHADDSADGADLDDMPRRGSADSDVAFPDM